MGSIVAEDVNKTSSSLSEQAVPKYASSRHRNVPFSYDKQNLKISNRFIDEPRSLRVAVIGGGLTGIIAGILLPQKVPGIQLTIYEKNHDFVSTSGITEETGLSRSADFYKGGTWLENVYPGVRCDIPSHVYQSTFSPKHDWSDKFAPGSEIRDYWQSVARKYDVYQYARFNQKVDDALWAGDHWELTTLDGQTGQVIMEQADFVITAVGKFNSWKLPDYPGIADYKGHLRHASNWDPTFDPTGKRVAVIGKRHSSCSKSAE
jgi:cation diffusion facilitator CzcD-associated flavoprotein CzcO